MGKPKFFAFSSPQLLLVSITLLSFHFHPSTQLEYSQFHALLLIQKLFNFPPSLHSFYTTSDFCNIEPTQSFAVSCYGNNLTQLHIDGQNGDFPLPSGFSTQALFSRLTAFSSLKVLSLVSLGLQGPLPAAIGHLSSLEILNISSNKFSNAIPEEVSFLQNLETLILDNNHFSDQVPALTSSLQSLTVLSLKNNSLSGSLPNSLSAMRNLRILALSGNNLTGDIPDLQHLQNLQVLDLQENHFGPHFPRLPSRLITIVLRKNKFALGLPSEMKSFYQLQRFDVSMNGFVGPLLPYLISLPSIKYLDIGGNKFTGLLMKNMSCSPELAFVNFSSNLLTGHLPTCLQKGKLVFYSWNCLSSEEQDQHPSYFCHNEALAVTIMPPKEKQKRQAAKTGLLPGILGGVLGGITFVGLVFIAARKIQSQHRVESTPVRLLTENAPTVSNVKLLSDARYISQTMKMGASIPTYRTFALEELKNATNNFDASSLISECSQFEMYGAKLEDGTTVAIRRLETRKRRSPQTYMPDIERISRLRHSNLLSALGHCFECHPDDSNVANIYIIFESATNGTLRDHISGIGGKKLTWVQRIVSAMGVVKGIQFLHTGIVPGVFSNDVKITDVLMDHSLGVKISKYNLPLLAEDGKVSSKGLSGNKGASHSRLKHEDRNDVYDIGVILLEIIVGRAVMYPNEVTLLKDLIQVSLVADEASRRSIVDPFVHKDCSDDSLRTVMEICLRCLAPEQINRPSVEDVLWNLQFAIQVQESFKRDSQNFQEIATHETFVDVPL